MHKNSLIHELQNLSSMLHAQVVIRCAGLQALDCTHIRMIGHKPHELQHLITLVESPHLMALELGNWPTHFASIHEQINQWLLLAFRGRPTTISRHSICHTAGTHAPVSQALLCCSGLTAIRKSCRLMRLPHCVADRLTSSEQSGVNFKKRECWR